MNENSMRKQIKRLVDHIRPEDLDLFLRVAWDFAAVGLNERSKNGAA